MGWDAQVVASIRNAAIVVIIHNIVIMNEQIILVSKINYNYLI